MNDDMTNPVMNQIESLTGGSLATKVNAPEEQQTPVGGEQVLGQPEMSQDLDLQPNTEEVQQQEEQEPVIPDSAGQQSPSSLENVMDPVSYNRRRFQKVNPYTVTMPNGDQFETTSLDKDKILYDYYKTLRNSPDGLAFRESLAGQADRKFFGYLEIPEGVKESLVGSAGRGFVNTFTSMPFDAWATANLMVGSTGKLTPEQQKDLQNRIDSTLRTKNDFIAHPTAYWIDTQESTWANLGNGIGSVAASVVPAFLTGGATVGVNLAERAAIKGVTKAATKRLGKGAAEGAAESMATRATNIKNLRREFKRNPNFDPSTAKKSLTLTYTNRLANGLNYGIAAGEAADASVQVYLDALSKTNDFDYAASKALQAGGIVGVLGASPEWVHGAYGALTGASRRMWKAAVAGDKAALRRMVAGDVLMSAGLEGISEVAQDVTTLSYMNKPIDPKEEFMTFALAGIMAGTMTGVSNRRTPSRAIENATEFKKSLKAVLKARAAIFNKMLGSGSSSVVRDEDIDTLLNIVDDPNFETLAQKIVKKGILENVDKMDSMEDSDKKALKEMLERDDYDASIESFREFDKNIDDTILANDTELTPAQRIIFKSIMHGVAEFAIMSGRISNPNELLQLDSLTGLNTGGTESYVENGNAYIATADNTNLAPYSIQQAEINPNDSVEKQTSARVNNQIEKSATQGMTQGAVDILHEVLGHLFASDVVADGDLPHFMIRYTELLEEAIKEVMPNAVIDENTPIEMLDEYRAYAMANSSKIAEMLGFKGDTAKLFKFFEQMTLANRANFGAIKDYVDTLRTMLEENSEAIRGIIDAYGEDLPGALKHYADTGDAGLLTNDDLKALTRLFQTGLADSDVKLDVMSAIGDNDTYQSLSERLGSRFDTAVEQDKADASAVLNNAIKQAQDNIENAPNAPINEESVEALDELSKKQMQDDEEFLNNMPDEENKENEPKKTAKTMVDNPVTFDGKKYYYLTKRRIEMPNPEAVKQVRHTKAENEPESTDTETYRASQLATTGLTKDELDALTNWSLNEIKKNVPEGIFDSLMQQINQVIESDAEVVNLPTYDSQHNLSGYEFKYLGEFKFDNSKLKLDKNNIFSNKDQRTSALSSDIAYYIMAKRAAKADNRRYSVRNINGIITEYLKNNNKDQMVLDSIAGRLQDYEEQYQAFTSDEESNSREYRKLLEELLDTLVENNINIKVKTAVASSTRSEKLDKVADWYEKFHNRLTKENDVVKAKKIVEDKLTLTSEEKAELSSLPTTEDVVEFANKHSSAFKYIYKNTDVLEKDRRFSDIIKDELDILAQDENAEERDVAFWYNPGKSITSAQKKSLKLGAKAAMSSENRAKAISDYLKTKPELHTTKDESVASIWSSTKIDSLFSTSGVKSYNPLTNYRTQIGFAAAQGDSTQEEASSMDVRYTTPEEYGFDNARQMQEVFKIYDVPSVTFDTDLYLNAPRTGKLNKTELVSEDEFLKDFADIATEGVASLISKNGVLSARDRLIYVKAVLDAYEAGRAAYRQYTEELQKRAKEQGLRLAPENRLLNDEGYTKFASQEECAKNDIDLKQSLLFQDMDKKIFDFYPIDSEYGAQMFPVNNTRYLTLGRVVRFPYGMNPRIGMIVGEMDVSRGPLTASNDKVFLFRTAASLKNGIKYEEFYIPRSDFEEMLSGGDKQIMVSDGVFDEIGRNLFNRAFEEKLGSKGKLGEAIDVVDTATFKRAMLRPSESPQTRTERTESDAKSKKVRFTVRPTVSQGVADLLKSLTPADEEYDADLTDLQRELMKERDVRRNLQNYVFGTSLPGQSQTQEEFFTAYAAYEKSKELDRKSASDFANESFLGTQNIVDYINSLTQKANESRRTDRIHHIPLFLGSQAGTDKVYRMVFGGEDPLARSLVETAQIMTEKSENATQQLQMQIAKVLQDEGGAQSFNKYFRRRLQKSPIKAKLVPTGKEADITIGEIQHLYAAYLVETSVLPNGKYKYEQTIIDGGNNIYTRLKNKMYKNADELIGQLSETDKLVVESMLDFFTRYSKSEGKRFVLSLGSYVKSAEKGWDLRREYFTRATKAEMTDQNSLLLVNDLFDVLNADFKANAIYNSGVKKDLTTMKNMLLFGLKYSNAEDGLSGYERFLEDFRLRGESDENSDDFKAYQSIVDASNALREAVRETLGKYGFERFMKRLDFEESKPDKAINILPSWAGKLFERTTRTSMASKLALKPKNALQNFVGNWQRCCPLADSTGKWYTVDLLDAIIHIKDALESAKDNDFITQRFERNALGAEYQKVTDASSVESILAELSIKAANLKRKGHVTMSKVLGLMDDFAKKMTKITVGYGTSGADYLALALAWYKLKPSLVKQAREINKANIGSEKAIVTAQNLFMNHVLRTISSSNFMTRSPLQNWAIRNHMGALTAFLNDSLQSYSAIGEAWYSLPNAKTEAEKRYLRRIITSNIASQLFYIATQIGAFSAIYGLVATDDGLTDAEQKYLWDSLLREFVGQLSSMTPWDAATRPVLETLFLSERRQSGNVLVSSFQDIAADINNLDAPRLLADTADVLGGFAGSRRIVDMADALWAAYSQEDEMYRATGEILYGRTKNTALKIQGLRENSKGKVVNKK